MGQNVEYCFANRNDTYLIYLPEGGEISLDLTGAKGEFSVRWFNPRTGGELQSGSTQSVTGGDKVSLGTPPTSEKDDWLAVVRR